MKPGEKLLEVQVTTRIITSPCGEFCSLSCPHMRYYSHQDGAGCTLRDEYPYRLEEWSHVDPSFERMNYCKDLAPGLGGNAPGE